jgi:hypothetical protein
MEKYKKTRVNVDVSSGIYAAGFLMAAGMQYAQNGHQFWNAIWHGIMSWAYVGYFIVDFLTQH